VRTNEKVTTLRHMLSMLSDEERTMMLIERLKKQKPTLNFLNLCAGIRNIDSPNFALDFHMVP